jgi:hypothetical protein
MRKLLVALLLIGALVVGLVYFTGSAVLDRASREALPRLQSVLQSQDVLVSELDFSEARITSFNEATWYDLEAVVRFAGDGSPSGGQAFRVRVDSVSAELQGLALAGVDVALVGLEGTAAGELASEFDWASRRFKQAALDGRLRAELVRFPLEVDLRAPGPGIRRAVDELNDVVESGSTSLPAEVYASVTTLLDGEPVGVRLRAVPHGERTVVQVDENDLRRQAGHFSRPLTDGEIKLVAEHPLRAPRLLFIKKYAENTALDAHEKDRKVPQDAYRHVLWSYLLTREFGPAFAEQVTDAHEVGSTTNTEADHRMDYNNNAVGRRYAADGVRESEILARVQAGPNVIRSAS